MRRAFACSWLLGVLACAFFGACGSPDAPSPFLVDAGFIPSTSTGAGGEGGSFDAGGDADPTLGGPCEDDGQCDDGIACTADECDDDLKLCRFTPDPTPCQNEVHCDGEEVCKNKLGCAPGEPLGCSDDTPCTIDSCDEVTKACVHVPRDVDRDGDVDGHCPGGSDCDDNDPTVSSLVPEVCQNQKDDNCDMQIDEATCSSPQHDTCIDPLEISQSGSYAMDTTAAKFDYASSCMLANQAQQRDVVAAVLIDPGVTVDVEVTARTQIWDVIATLSGQCGDAFTEIACGKTYPAPQGGKLAKLRGRGLGSPVDALALPLYVTTEQGSPVVVDVQYLPPAPIPANETCATADTIVPGVPVKAYILEAVDDLGTVCANGTGDLVYAFTLATDQNVDVYASSIDGDGTPSVSLRDPDCAMPEDEITCQTAAAAHVFWQSLPAGTYYVSVSASAPTELSVTVEVSPPTPPPPDETCVGSPILAPNVTIPVDVSFHQDDIQLGCFAGAPDAAYQLDLAADSDVLLVERIGMGDVGAIELATPACSGPADLLACALASVSPIRAVKHDVAAGEYRVVVESQQAKGTDVTAFVRPTVPPTLVPFADSCGDAVQIPSTGGYFQGNTANANADFNAGCDQGGQPAGGAPDQLLKIDLPFNKRVVMDMTNSGYTTILDVRKGPACPGQEIVDGCAVGYYTPGRSFLDVTIGPGVYYIQIDGLALDSGPWFLDVYVVDP